jgi:hypothetical protein
MGEKYWIQDLATGLDRLRIHFRTQHGQVIIIVVIRYEAYIDGKWRAIVRFDEAHGFFHRDVMSPTGEQEKTPLPSTDKQHTLNEAIVYLKENWRIYRQRYEEKYYGRN